MTRRMFAGGFTPIGFVDFFEYIMPLEIARKRYFLKGASGSGKSTFIKKTAAKFEAASADADLFHCANDSSGLDGIAVKEFGFCIMDATMPHSHDPEIPAATDEIIDFAKFLDAQKLRRHTDEIRQLLVLKKNMYKKALKFITAAGNIRAEETAAYEAALIKPRVRDLVRKYSGLFENCEMSSLGSFEKPGRSDCAPGTDRKLFLSAITPLGTVNFAEEVLSRYKVFGLSAEAGIFFADLKDLANACGINTESFFSPLEPAKRECVLLPQQGLAFATVGGLFGFAGKTHETIDLEGCYNTKKIISESPAQNEEIIKNLLDTATASMKDAAAIHKKTEEIYIDKMDFNQVNDLTDRILDEVFLGYS